MKMPENVIPAYDILIITGPTATGKTALAAAVAYTLNGEVISADSRQVYRGMDLGTGKDPDDYLYEGKKIPVHLIDITDPGNKYNVFEYQRDFLRIYEDLKSRNIFPVLCGGSGMYLDSVVSGYKLQEVPPDDSLREELEKRSMSELINILASYKKLHNKTDIDTKKRVIRAIEIEEYYRSRKVSFKEFPAFSYLIVGIMTDRATRRKRISERLKKRLDEGMVDEVRGLLEKGVDEEVLIYYGIEYKFITHYLKVRTDYDTMVKDLEVAIHQFAKRQMTWFRGMERRGIKINWIDGELSLNDKLNVIIQLLSKKY